MEIVIITKIEVARVIKLHGSISILKARSFDKRIPRRLLRISRVLGDGDGQTHPIYIHFIIRGI